MTMSSKPVCPVVHGAEFDPIEPAQVLDPHPWMKAARTQAPVFYMPKYDGWCVTRYEDVLAVLRDTATFSSKKVVEPRPLPDLERRLPDGHPVAKQLVNTDPPEHTRLRKLAQKAFTPRMVATYEPRVRAIGEELIGDRIDAGSMNLIDQFARVFTGKAITAVIGAPVEMTEKFMLWSDNVVLSMTAAPPLDAERELQLTEEVVDFNQWLLDFIEDRRANPREDYVSLLVHARSDEEEVPTLTTAEVLRILSNVISAGLDTTSSLIGFTVYNLLSERDRWERLLADPSLVPLAIEETLRRDGPIHGIRRDVLADTEVGGLPIPAGSVLYLSYASAQRDEAVFEDADAFDIDRDDLDKHYAFGKWTHFCLGAPLARMETKVAVEILLKKIPTLRLAPDAEPEVFPSRLGAFLTGLELEWDLARDGRKRAGLGHRTRGKHENSKEEQRT